MAARRMTDTAIQSSDLSKIMSAYKAESNALRVSQVLSCWLIAVESCLNISCINKL